MRPSRPASAQPGLSWAAAPTLTPTLTLTLTLLTPTLVKRRMVLKRWPLVMQTAPKPATFYPA